MFCNQCEQTSRGTGCTTIGVCGKVETVAHLQDCVIYALRGLAQTALKARAKGIIDDAIDNFTVRALFTTLTNVNFSERDVQGTAREALLLRKRLASRLGCTPDQSPAAVDSALAELKKAPTSIATLSADPNVQSAMQLLLYGLKGVAAYADHALLLGKRDPALFTFIYEALAAGIPDKDGKIAQERSLGAWLELILACGKANLRAMELLEQGNTETFGHPVPTPVFLGQRAGKAILVSGHDLLDLFRLLKATEGTGINIYTHGEMLPAHGYPVLHAFPHLVGHYGTAWQNQHKELAAFPGAVLFTTNCIQDPKLYSDKVFTTGAVGWPGLVHCPHDDFSAVINKALSMDGFSADVAGKSVLTGFGRQTLLNAAPAVLEAVKSGAIKHIFLVGGCDGAKPGRNYYTEFVEKTPADTLVLTLACGKFRFFDKDLGTIGDFPRLMDVGQCNDAYAAVQVALALAEALGCTVNDLPLSLVLSWYEQKAVSILLTLLALGVKNIRLGPSLPAFVSPDILNVLVKEWNIAPITTPDADLQAILGK
ncbi:MAG: hydroxylamine reductase [Desulfovibrionaceae bacterium]